MHQNGYLTIQLSHRRLSEYISLELQQLLSPPYVQNCLQFQVQNKIVGEKITIPK